MKKDELVINWLLAIVKKESREWAISFANRVWDRNFTHCNFQSWNINVSENVVDIIMKDTLFRSTVCESDLVTFLVSLGASNRFHATNFKINKSKPLPKNGAIKIKDLPKGICRFCGRRSMSGEDTCYECR